jgi:hypothetical protein
MGHSTKPFSGSKQTLRVPLGIAFPFRTGSVSAPISTRPTGSRACTLRVTISIGFSGES